MTENDKSVKDSIEKLNESTISLKTINNLGIELTESEALTRRNKIDRRLNLAGWNPNDSSQVKQEIDTKNSDFKARDYKTFQETFSTNGDKAYADYILLGKDGLPIAVIEAKKTSVDSRVAGQTQAEDYAKDIKMKTDSDVFIYLTNGIEIWFWNKGYENPRKVSGFHSRADLEKFIFQNKNKKSFSEVKIREDIISRPYQIEAVKRVTEGIESGKRKFLLVMATGTGKTRVAMSIIDMMLKSRRASRILFLVDRDELRTQAHDENISRFFVEPSDKIFSKNVSTDKNIYVSTLQTMENVFQDFPVGFFDLIISDEAHRSIFVKFKNIFRYFDSIQIGLTATPADMVSRNTYDFFECENNDPTFLFTYEEAVPEYLVPFKAFPVQTHFQVEGITPEDIPDEEKERLLSEEGIDDSALSFAGSEIEKKVSVTGTIRAWITEFMDNCQIDESGLPCKTIIFPTSINHGKLILEEFEKLYPQYKGEMAKLITSQDSNAKKSVKQFKENSLPRIAISVGILDTGVDVPEICNLVFARPTRSKIRFWQMIGRGTRHETTCEHKDWIPPQGKKYFLIFDYMKNFESFEMKPDGEIPSNTEAISARILLAKIEQYKSLVKKNG